MMTNMDKNGNSIRVGDFVEYEDDGTTRTVRVHNTFLDHDSGRHFLVYRSGPNALSHIYDFRVVLVAS